MSPEQLHSWSERMAKSGWVTPKEAELWLIAKDQGEDPAIAFARWTVGEPVWSKLTDGAMPEAIRSYLDRNGFTRKAGQCEDAAKASKRNAAA